MKCKSWPKHWYFIKYSKLHLRKKLPCISDIINQVSSRKEFVNRLFSNREIRKIEKRTIGQSDNIDWFYYRKGVVTATCVKRIVNAKKSKNINYESINKAIEKRYSPKLYYPALIYGCENESKGLEAFYHQMKHCHRNLKIQHVGLKLDESMQYLGGSGDGMVLCDCCTEPSLIEIKCPHRLRNSSVEKNGHILNYLDENFNLIKSHQYYYQINVCLGVWGYKKCYFVVYTPNDILIREVYFDAELYSTIKNCVNNYYFNHFLKL